jgi:hypothetical protein
MPKKLYRPVGLQELALLWDSGMRAFPRRLVHQPIFYPVLNLEYARQIARDWNTPDEHSGFAGYVTEFGVSSSYLTKFDVHTAGSARHREYWIPAKEMGSFNKAIKGMISVEEAYFGAKFAGFVPDEHALKGQNAIEQFQSFMKLLGRPEFVAEVSASRKAVFLNSLYWVGAEPASLRCNQEQRDLLMKGLVIAWEAAKIDVPLPIHATI